LSAAKYGRIEKIGTVFRVSFLFSQACRGEDRAHVHRDLPFFDSAENSFRAKHNVLDSFVVTQTVHEKVRVAGCVGRSILNASAFPGEWLASLSVPIPNGKFVTGFEKVRRHPAAHGPETEIGDCLYHNNCSFRSCAPDLKENAEQDQH
jgi:hypothetical protein